MSSEDEYIPRSEVKETGSANLSSIPTPPGGAIKSSLLTAMKYRSLRSALRAYEAAFSEMTRIEHAQADFHEAKLRTARTVDLLKNAEHIHAQDRARWKLDRLDAEEELAERQHQAGLARRRREAEASGAEVDAQRVREEDDLADAEHQAFMNKLRREKERAQATSPRLAAEMEVFLDLFWSCVHEEQTQEERDQAIAEAVEQAAAETSLSEEALQKVLVTLRPLAEEEMAKRSSNKV
ncbi:MAG: hypothetical protein LC677_14965 [Halomonas sp.]|nr:hypothetical protein [Halomonas sp.]